MIKRICKQCGKEFTLNDSEIKFYKEKNLDLPKRCSECRKENKNNKDDLNKEITIDKEAFASKGKNTPFQGRKYFGEIVKTIKGGKVIYSK